MADAYACQEVQEEAEEDRASFHNGIGEPEHEEQREAAAAACGEPAVENKEQKQYSYREPVTLENGDLSSQGHREPINADKINQVKEEQQETVEESDKKAGEVELGNWYHQEQAVISHNGQAEGGEKEAADVDLEECYNQEQAHNEQTEGGEKVTADVDHYDSGEGDHRAQANVDFMDQAEADLREPVEIEHDDHEEGENGAPANVDNMDHAEINEREESGIDHAEPAEGDEPEAGGRVHAQPAEEDVREAENEDNLDQEEDENEAAEPAEEDEREAENADNIDPAVEEYRELESQKKDEDKWSQHDIQSLLVKAINHKSPVKDLEICVKCGADVNRAVKSGLFPIHYASYNDYIGCVKFLLDNGANVNATDDIGYTPIHLAARCGNYNTMMMLIDNGAMITFNEPGQVIRNTDEKNKLGYSTAEPINLAIQNGYTDCAKLLLDHGARADNNYFMGREICLAPLDEPECIEILLKYGADPNVFNRCGLSPLMRACKGQHVESVRILLRYGADVNLQCPPLFERKTALIYAIASGSIVIINLLLGRKASLKRSQEYRYSPLQAAVKKGRAEVVRLFLQQGADVNEKSEEGASALMLACGTPGLRDREEIVKLLICCGADINAHSPSFSYSDLYLAPLTEYLKNIGNTENFSIVEILIQNGAKVNYCEGEKGLPISKKINPFSILQYADCMASDWKMFELTLIASTQYNPLAVHACDTLPDGMKNEILAYATTPRSLKHILRHAIHDILYPDMADKVQELPLPTMLKTYILYK